MLKHCKNQGRRHKKKNRLYAYSLKLEKKYNNNKAVFQSDFRVRIHMTNPNIFGKLLWDNSEQFAALYRTLSVFEDYFSKKYRARK